jgi:hypothetical protein
MFKLSGLMRVMIRDIEKNLVEALAATFSMPINMVDEELTQTTLVVEDDDLAKVEMTSDKTGISKDAIVRLLLMYAVKTHVKNT